MILTCPACSTQYAVKDGAIPEGGRQVRCAACKHSWHQDPEAVTAAAVESNGDLVEAPPHDEGAEAAAAPLVEDEMLSADEAAAEPAEWTPAGYSPIDPIARSEPVAEPSDAGLARDDEFSPFADRGDYEDERRSPLRGLLIAVLVLALLGVLLWFVAPAEWKARVGLAEGPATPLQLMMTHSDRQRLASGNELLAITGRVINPTDERHPVPPIQAQLRSRSGQLVHSWTIAPPAPSLGPGESRPFNSAEVNVPTGGDELTISLGSPRA